MQMTPIDEFLTTRQVSDWLHIPASTLHDLRSRGQGPAATVFSHRNIRYARDDVAKWILACREGAAKRPR